MQMLQVFLRINIANEPQSNTYTQQDQELANKDRLKEQMKMSELVIEQLKVFSILILL